VRWLQLALVSPLACACIASNSPVALEALEAMHDLKVGCLQRRTAARSSARTCTCKNRRNEAVKAGNFPALQIPWRKCNKCWGLMAGTVALQHSARGSVLYAACQQGQCPFTRSREASYSNGGCRIRPGHAAVLPFVQGMSVAAVGSVMLDRALGRALQGSAAGKADAAGGAQQGMQSMEGLRHLAHSFQREWFDAVETAWNIHCSEGMR
jgi:hypothetical protein